jgi:hypothetical protein
MKTNITLKGMALATGLTLALSAAGVANADLTMPYGSGTTTYSVMNVGSAPATVVATYYNPNGTTPPGSGSTHTLNVNGRLDIAAGQAPDGPLPSNWSGSVVLSSDQDIVAVARTKYMGRMNANENSPYQTPGTESSAYEAFNSGSTALYFPVIVRVKQAANPTVAQLATRFTVQNTSASPATVYLNFRNFDNTTYAPVIVTLNGYGSKTWDTAVDADLPPGLNLAPNSIALSLLVTGTQPLVGVAEQSWNFDGLIGATPVKQNWAADYAAIPASEATTTLYGPLVARVGAPIGSSRPCTFSVYTTFAFYTQFAVQNTTATTATVTAQFIRSNNTGSGVNAPSGLANGSVSVQIPPFGTWNVNTFGGGNLGYGQSNSAFWNIFADGYNASTGAATHCNWNGAVVFTSDQPVVGFGFIQQPLSIQNYASAFNFFGASGATSTALLPRADRVCTGSCTFTAVEQFPDFSSLTVQNVGGANTNLTVTFYNPNGTVNQTFTVDGVGNPITLAPGQQYSFNTRAGANASIAQTQALGNNFKGTVRVTASGSVPIRIFNNLVSGMDDADAYVGFNR